MNMDTQTPPPTLRYTHASSQHMQPHTPLRDWARRQGQGGGHDEMAF